MRYSSILVIIINLYNLPVSGYRSGNTSIIGVKKKQSLLDRNYIFDHINISGQNYKKIHETSIESLEQLSNLSLKPKLTKTPPNKNYSSTNKKNKAEALNESLNDWGGFQEEIEEDLAVKARIVF